MSWAEKGLFASKRRILYMKFMLFSFLFALILSLAGGEREDLLATFRKENLEADKTFQNAVSTVALTGEAGTLWNIAEKQYFRALDYKLRHTSDAGKRLELLKKSHMLSREVEKIFSTPRENMGSLIGMLIYHKIAGLFQQQIAILMLDTDAEKRWQRIADIPLFIDGKKISQKQGKGKFTKEMYGAETTLEFMLLPEDTFTFQNRDFALIRTGRPFSVNDDFSTVYLFELKDGKLQVNKKCDFPFYSRWKLQKSEFVICYKKKMQKIQLSAAKEK